jgi:hypothetical protein
MATADQGSADRIKKLYAVAPEDFIAQRNALARDLADAGEPGVAAEVKKLRKPSVAAWAVNAAARAHPDDVAALLEAGDRLQRAQRGAVAGKGAGELLEATQARRKLVATLTSEAVDALGDRGGAHRDAIAATFEAGSVDADLGARLRDGTLEREATPGPGLGSIEGFQVLTGGAAEGEEDRGDESAERAELERRARQASRSAEAAEREAERASGRAEQLREKARAASVAADAAEAEARRLADEARTERRRADRAERSVR